MSSIFHGGNAYIFYNADAGNNLPTSIDYKNIDNLGSFPQVKIQSSTTQLETYNDEWVQVLSGQMSIQGVSIVVHYVPDNFSHQFLDGIFTDGTKFQIKVSLYESQTSLDQHYVILSGYISAYQDSADQNEIFDRTYTFTAEDVIARGTAQDPAPLRQGDFGVGSNGESIPQYESTTPTGNSFIKVPATSNDNPIGVDLGGFAYVDNGGDQGAKFVISETGPINIYTKNTDTEWTLLPTTVQNNQLYVPVTRTLNGYPLSTDIVLNQSDVRLSEVLNVPSYSKTESDNLLTDLSTETDSKITDLDTAKVEKTTTVNGYPLSDNVVLNQSDVGLDKVLNIPSYSKSESDALLTDLSTETDSKITDLDTAKVDKTTTINGYALSDDIELSSTDTGSLAKANNLSDVQDISTARTNLQAAKSGVNSDITGLTTLSGSLRLGGDAAADYDAVTLKQLLASSGGAGGPSLTGVMNNYIGCVSWFNGSRAKLPAANLASDGQVLNRADYPELWNAISTGMLTSVTDTVWLATTASRASYSTGDGTTTFRMPDLNGKTSGSIQGLFLRGDGTGFTSGSVLQNAVPNIGGSVDGRTSSTTGALFNNAANGVFTSSNPATGLSQLAQAASTGAMADRNVTLSFDSSKSNASYGRDQTTEVRPNAATGIWVIRVNGMFSASNTNFNVYNGDTALPAAGTVVYGGDIRSVYQVAGADYGVARLRSKITVGGIEAIELGFQDSSTGSVTTSAIEIRSGASGSGGAGSDIISTSGELGLYSLSLASVRLRADGTVRIQNSTNGSALDLNASGIIVIGNIVGQSSQLYVQRGYFNQGKDITNGEIAIFNSNADATVGVRFGIANLASGNARRFYAGDINGNNQLVQTLPNSTGTITVTTSDKNLKNYTGDVVLEDAYNRISLLKPVEYTWNEKFAVDPEILNKPRRGLFAQDAYEIDERYAVKPTDEQLEIDIVWGLEDRAIMADMIATIQLLQQKVLDLQSQINK